MFELPERYFADEQARARRILGETKALHEQQDSLGATLELPGNRFDCIRLTLHGLHNEGLFRVPGLVSLVP